MSKNDTKIKDDESFAHLSGLTLESSADMATKDENRLVAFYLPQYHRVPENSSWWGPGFTEWTNVAGAKPNFPGHYQPHIPRELGFYDLGDISVMREQSELALLYGIEAFCFYHYWFSGRTILEKPVEQFISSDIDMGFCLCWANENWTKTWDGKENEVLLEQKYLADDPEHFMESIEPALLDPRYIRVSGELLVVVYRAKSIPKVRKVFSRWRAWAKDKGLGNLHIAVVDFYDISDPSEVGADALVEFPPHKFNYHTSAPDKLPKFFNKDFLGDLIDYKKVMMLAIQKEEPNYPYYRAIMPSWDNTARRQNTPMITVNSNPQLYGIWLDYVREYTNRKNKRNDEDMIFINAWNEWGEGCHMEPDLEWGLGYLEETMRSAYRVTPLSSLTEVRNRAYEKLNNLSGDGASSAMVFDEDFFFSNRKTGSSRIIRLGATSKRFLRRFPFIYSFMRDLYHKYIRSFGQR